jgi:hypothetical protein
VTVEDEPGRVDIVILGPRNRALATYLSVFAFVWVMGGPVPLLLIAAGVQVRTRSAWSLDTFVVVWIVVLLVGGVLPFWAYLRSAAIRELITVDGQTLRLERSLLGLARARAYDLARVSNLQSTDPPDRRLTSSAEWRAWGRPGGNALAFDYDGRTHTFGHRLDEEQVAYILQSIRRRFPALLAPP